MDTNDPAGLITAAETMRKRLEELAKNPTPENMDEIKSLNLQLQTYYDILTSILKAQEKIIQATARGIIR